MIPKWLDLPPLEDDELLDVAGQKQEEVQSLVGFEDLGQALANDNDYSFFDQTVCGLCRWFVRH